MANKKITSPEGIAVMKTYKLFIGGAFPRTESGRFYPIRNGSDELIANVCLSSRKDFRNAVVAARKAQAGWGAKSAYNRSQIIYRIAEMLQQREELFVKEMKDLGYTDINAKEEFSASVDYLVHFAGWCDKYVQVFSSVNPVASSHFNFSVPEPMGVVAAFASNKTALLGFLESFVPAICGGNTTIVLASEDLPTCAISMAEVLATSDVPGGTVNVLTGNRKELMSHFSSHMDVNGFVIWDAETAASIEIGESASENVKRVKFYESEDSAVLSPHRIMDLQEIKTTWHPIESISGSGSGY
ncbi:MAG: acyl-CoA reductase-like NAD-dependent aldehyde dehydrogenase [Flammeovirgaceae bacterium]|jgi:acyl-CoA reductase-like NAD-dependent aldehyde dehydrogenase